MARHIMETQPCSHIRPPPPEPLLRAIRVVRQASSSRRRAYCLIAVMCICIVRCRPTFQFDVRSVLLQDMYAPSYKSLLPCRANYSN